MHAIAPRFFRITMITLALAAAFGAGPCALAADPVAPDGPAPAAEVIPPVASPGTMGHDTQVGPLLTMPGDSRKGARLWAPRHRMEYIAPAPASPLDGSAGVPERPANANEEPALRR